MYCLVIIPQLCRTDAEVEALRGQFANPAHYEYLIEEDAIVIGPDGVIARLVTDCLEERLVANTRGHFAKVKGNLSARPSVVGKGAMMPRLRETDGSMGHTNEVPAAIIKKMRANNTYSDFLGWMDKSKYGSRFPECRQTSWSRNSPEIHGAAEPFIRAVDTVYAQELPEHCNSNGHGNRSERRRLWESAEGLGFAEIRTRLSPPGQSGSAWRLHPPLPAAPKSFSVPAARTP